MNFTLPPTNASPNPRRVLAGRLNRRKRGDLSAEARERLRKSALANRPWEQSTGPKTPKGKARSAQNGRKRQTGDQSTREIRSELAGVNDLIKQMRAIRSGKA